MIGEILENRYRIESRIGGGGMATVYLAFDLKLHRKVAVKVMHDHLAKIAEIRRRFDLEAQAVSALNHPNIVKIYDYSGVQSPRSWLVTEVIDGLNLAEYLNLSPLGRVHPIIGCFIVREISKALGAAHTAGIVHRDIKPENIMITDSGLVRLMDFGIAKDLQQSSFTQTGTFMGSPSYMSPEQIKGKGVDTRSDIYSLSVLFYEIITGELPFKGNSSHDVVMKIMAGRHVAPQKLVSYLPEEMTEIIRKGMAQRTELRYQSTRELEFALDKFLFAHGFVESHVELERYFINKQSAEDRLRQKICFEYFADLQKIIAKSSTLQRSQGITIVKNKPSSLPTLPSLATQPPNAVNYQEKYYQQAVSAPHLLAHQATRKAQFIDAAVKNQSNVGANYSDGNRTSKLHSASKNAAASAEGHIESPERLKSNRVDGNSERAERPVFNYGHRVSRYRRHAVTSYKDAKSKRSWLALLIVFAAAGAAGILFIPEKMVDDLFINKIWRNQITGDKAVPRGGKPAPLTTNALVPGPQVASSVVPGPQGAENFSTPASDSVTKPNAETAAATDLQSQAREQVKFEVTITSNTRPIKVVFINQESAIGLEYIQSSLQETYLLVGGKYQVKAYYQKQSKKSSVFILEEDNAKKSLKVQFNLKASKNKQE